MGRGLFLRISTAAIAVCASVAAYASSLALENLGSFHQQGRRYSALWGYTAPDGREYAIHGAMNGTSIVDITDAPQLKEVAFIPFKESSPWTEMKTYKHYAYVIKDSADVGIQIIDLSKLPASAEVVNTVMDYPQNHTLWIDQERGWMFTVGGSNMGVTAWSLEDPVHPKQISIFNQATYVHDMYVHGNRAYLAEILSKTFSIYDISDLKNPVLIKRVRDASAPSISFHNTWTTEDGRYLLTTEETSGRAMRIWDLADEKNPVEVSRWLGPGDLAHNVHVKGNFAHIAHYGGGYRILDLTDIRNPVEVAFFNNKPTNQPGFVGVWEVYPYFPSGKVIMSSIEDGLFITRFDR
jgi:choice-of-anchor B domain-containing protein